jgi:VWFA-related protein
MQSKEAERILGPILWRERLQRSYATLALTAVLVCGQPVVLCAQNPAPLNTQLPVYKTGARDVVVDVVVTDGKGGAIAGLHASSFDVLEDGKPQTIDFFEEHTAKTLPPGELQPLPKMPPGVYTNVPPAPESDAVNVLLLDTLNTDRGDQSYVRENILNFLKTMQPGLRVAVFVLGAKLRMVQGFTTDSGALRAAVTDKKAGVSPEADTSVTRSLQDKVDDLEDKQRLAGMNMSPTGLDALSAMQEAVTAHKADERVAMTLQALNYMARYLAGVPGRKNLIWFSNSFPVTVFPGAKEKQPGSQIREYSAALKETADLLTVSKVAVYPVGAEGMMVSHNCDPVINTRGCYDIEGGEVSGSSGPGSTARSVNIMDSYTNEAAARSDKIMAMEQLAADTGGKAFYNTNDLNGAMQRAIADGSHYYTIVYSPTNKKMDGSYRRIQIKLDEGRYKLAYRRGYNAEDVTTLPTNPGTHPLQSLMTRGMPDSTQILYGVRVMPSATQPAADAPRAGKNSKLAGSVRRYDVDFMIRWTDVRLDATPQGTHAGKIQAELLAYDRDGSALNWTGVTAALDLKPEIYTAIQHSGVPAHLVIDVPADKDVFLATGVYDWATGKAGTLEIPLHPGNIRTAASSQTSPNSNAKPN